MLKTPSLRVTLWPEARLVGQAEYLRQLAGKDDSVR